MRLGDRMRASARRARAGRDGGLAGRLLSRLRPTTPPPVGGDGRLEADPAAPGRTERVDPWDEQPADAYDDRQLAALRAELNEELERLARPRNDEAPGP